METFFQIQTEFGNGRIGKNVVRYRRWLTVCVRGFLRLSRTLLFFHISWIWKISWVCLLWASAMDGPFVRVEVIMIYFYGLYMLRLSSIALTTEKDALSSLLQTKWPFDTKRKGNSEKKIRVLDGIWTHDPPWSFGWPLEDFMYIQKWKSPHAFVRSVRYVFKRQHVYLKSFQNTIFN